MNALVFLATIVESLGEAATDAEAWAALAPKLVLYGQGVGLETEIIEAVQESSNFLQFYGKLATTIAGGDVGAAAVVVLASAALNLAVGGGEIVSTGGALYLVAVAAGLPASVALGGAATILALGYVGGSFLAGGPLFNTAYNDLAQAFTAMAGSNAVPPAPWTNIGTDSSGNSLLFNAVYNNDIAGALGLSTDSTMLVDMAAAAFNPGSLSVGAAASSLSADANLLGQVVGSGELIGALAGANVTEALCEILVQYAGDQAATASANGGGAFANSDSRLLNINLDPQQWAQTYGQAQPDIVGVRDLLDAVAAKMVGGPTTFADNYLLQNNPSLIEAALRSGASLDDSGAANGNAVLIGQSDTTINAGNGNDLIVGGQNVTVGDGNNIIVGADGGGETINVGAGSNLIYAAGDGDVINVNAQGAGLDTPLPNPGINIIYAPGGGDTININCGQGVAGLIIDPVSNVSETSALNLDQSAFINAIDTAFVATEQTYENTFGQYSPIPVHNVFEPTSYDTQGLSGFNWTVLVVPNAPDVSGDGFTLGSSDSVELNSGASGLSFWPTSLVPLSGLGALDYSRAITASNGYWYDIGDGRGLAFAPVDPAAYQQTNNAPPAPPPPAAPPLPPVDPGPTTGPVSATVDVGQSMDLTSAILGAATPGLPGDTLTITGDAPDGALGTISLVNGDLVYTANAADFAALAPNASEMDSFTYTISDQVGDHATGAVSINVDNLVAIINGPQYGGGTIAGVSGPEIITASGWSNVIDANGGSGTINAGQGSATVNAGSGDLTINLQGYDDVVNGGDGADTVSGSAGNATITLGNGDDSISASGYNNIITLGNGNDSVSAGQGSETITLGNGDNTITASGYNNVISVGDGANTISAGDGSDTVTANGGDNTFNFNGWNDYAILNGGASGSIYDQGAGLHIEVASPASTISVSGFDSQIWIDLLNPNFGFASTGDIVNSLASDGHGGTLLAFGQTGSIDFLNMAPTQLHASNFAIG